MDGQVAALISFDDGTGPALYAGGTFVSTGANVPLLRAARWDGTSWSQLGTGMSGSVHDFAVYDDGSGDALYACGGFNFVGNVIAGGIARWDGVSWSPLVPFGGLDGGNAETMLVFDDGSGPALYVGGSFTQVTGMAFNASPRIVRWDGTTWSPLGAPGNGTNSAVYALAAFDDGTGPALYLGGEFTTAGGLPASRIVKWDGTGWSTPGGGVDGTVRALKVFDDGSGPALYAGGEFLNAGGVSAPHVARWDGTSWSALGPAGSGADGNVWEFASFDDGSGPKLVVAGGFANAGGVSAGNLATWDGTSWSAFGGVGAGTDDLVLAVTSFDDGSGPALYAGGNFDGAGSVPAARIARWSAGTWSDLGEGGHGLDGSIFAIEPFDGGSGPQLVAGGNFTSAGGGAASRIARWDGASWSALGSGTDGFINSFAVFDDGSGPALYAGGGFTTAGGVPAAHIARWDGTIWSPVGAGFDGIVYDVTVADVGTGPALYASGSFLFSGSTPVARVARWDGTGWQPLGAGLSATGNEMIEYDDGSGPALYVGGVFSAAGSMPASFIAKWNGTSWSPLGSGTSSSVFSFAVHDDGTGSQLYVGGQFGSAGGVPGTGRIARWNGASWSPVGSPALNGWVFALEVFDDGFGPALIAGGTFTTAGGFSARRIAKWNGSQWSTFGTGSTNGANDDVEALCVFDDGGDGDLDLFVGGSFLLTGGLHSERIAQWHGCTAKLEPFCYGDGSAGPCPCGNAGLAQRGCDNSAASGGARLTASGSTSPDTLVLAQAGELSTALSIFLQGDQQLGGAVVFGDGLRCTGGVLKRLYVKSASGGSVSAPQGTDASITARSAALGDPIAPGDVRVYQVYYRDASATFCPAPAGSTFNVGNALRVTW